MTDHSDLIAELRRAAGEQGLFKSVEWSVLIRAASALSSQSLSLSEAREALKPFAKIYDESIRNFPEGLNPERDDNRHAWGFNRADLTWGDFRRAKSVLENGPAVLADAQDDVVACLLAEKPFWFDPATNFVHADDGGGRGVLWAPSEPHPEPEQGLAVQQWRWRYRNGEPEAWRDWKDGDPVVPFSEWNADLYVWETRTLYASLADAHSNPPDPDLSSLRKGAAVAVKPLEWDLSGMARGYPAKAVSIFGNYTAWEIEDGFWMPPEAHCGRRAGVGLQSALDAAQSDFETRIRSALVSGSREDGADG